MKKIREDFNKLRDRFLQSKIKEIRRNLYEIENKENLPKSKIKKIEQNLIELEQSLLKLNKYYDYDDIEYKGIRDVESVFNQSTDEDYYKPIKTISAFDDNYIEYESKGDKNKNLSPEEYLGIIRPYLRDMINTHETPMNLRVHSRDGLINYETQFGEWKIQLTMSIKFISSKDYNEIRIMYTKSDNIEIMMGSKTDDIIDELFKSLLQKYQEGLEESMRGSEFVFDSPDLLYYYLQKISLKRCESYVDSPKWLKDKGATINPKNKKDNKCFQYALTVALNHKCFLKKP